MKNTIKIDLSFLSLPGAITVLHNGSFLKKFNHDGNVVLELHDIRPLNYLEVFSEVDIKLNSISMFDMGQSKLVFLGQCVHNGQLYQSQVLQPGVTWKLEYSAPVFSWLHSVLNHGWIVGP